ncbi:carboxymuconolactone decarboxylase family protein [Agrococcus sp. TSP3-2-1]|uniref:carboxymuconolactone decarboxylase family protein n=1 Tax=Agrococcus sp. TSP3-2-1 TaxID=2804583 RepID=UPI003CF8BDCB
MGGAGFLEEPQRSDDVERMYAGDRESDGYVMNLTRVWAHAPAVHDAWTAFAMASAEAAGLTFRMKGVIVSALAGAFGDSYCSYAWGSRLALVAGPATAAAVLLGDDAEAQLEPAERVVAAWARRVARDPGSTTPADVAALRGAGLDDTEIVSLTAYIASRIAFSTVNAALGATPDAELHASAPEAVREAITWGRLPAV